MLNALTAQVAQLEYPGNSGPGRQPPSNRIGTPIAPADVTALEHFLTARWMLFSIAGGRPVSARACHQPWPLHRAQAQVLEDNLLTTVGLSVPQGEPLVHHSPGVDVAIGCPEP